jgi:hypothetical protein
MNRNHALRTILLGGLVVGALDGVAAMINFTLHGGKVTRLFQYVAAGLLGRASFERGMATVLLGVFLEFFIATGVMAVFYLASRWFPLLLRYAVISGILYGIAVFFFMTKVVVPLSAVPLPKSPPVLSRMLIEIGIHIFCVGLPAALVARACSRREPARVSA